MEELTVPINQSRYEELIDTETRVNVLVEHMRSEDYLGMEKAFRILGFKEDADRLKEKFEKEQEEHKKKYGEYMEVEE